MKKSLLGLLIAFLAFLSGVLTAEIMRLKQELILESAITVETEEICLLKIEPLKDDEEIEVVGEGVDQSFSGWYRLDYYKKMPEVNMILLGKYHEFNNDNGKEQITLNAGVFTDFEKYGDQGFVDDAWTEINGNRVKFKTNKIKGIEYLFEGAFFKNKTMGEEGENLLRGTLQKFVKGKKVAEVSGDFAYYEPHCWH